MLAAISRFVHYRIFRGEKGKSCSYWVAVNKDTHPRAKKIYPLWPSHFDESLEPPERGFFYEDSMEDPMDDFTPNIRKPGKLTEDDRAAIEEFQIGHGLEIDGTTHPRPLGTQMWNYLKDFYQWAMDVIASMQAVIDQQAMDIARLQDELAKGSEPTVIIGMNAKEVWMIALGAAVLGFLLGTAL